MPDTARLTALTMQLQEQFYESASVRWKRELPWLRLFRAFRIAMDFRKLVLAFLALLAMSLGAFVFSLLPFAPQSAQSGVREQPSNTISLDEIVRRTSHREPTGSFSTTPASWPWEPNFPGSPRLRGEISFNRALAAPGEAIASSLIQTQTLLAPWRMVTSPAQQIIFGDRSWKNLAWNWTHLLWALLVWGIFGGAIARITALELAGEGAPSLRESLKHSTTFLLSSLGSILLPVVGVAAFWLGATVIGYLGVIPGAGPILQGIFWGISLACGAVLALILIGVAAAWPLMYVTLSVEGSDAFDGLSRAYSYVFGRPWYAVGIATASLLYGGVVLTFLQAALSLSASLANEACGVEAIVSRMETSDIPLTQQPSSAPAPAAGVVMKTWWNQGFLSISTIFVYSYFWTVMTIAYFLLRHAEDATPFQSVYWTAPTPLPEGAPALSGSAAAEYRERKAAQPNSPEPAADQVAAEVAESTPATNS